MPSTRTSPKVFLTLAVSIVALSAAVLPASAGPRAGVQIVYMESAPQAAPKQLAQVTSPPPAVDKATQRIEFRYPGQAPDAQRLQPVSAPQPAPYTPPATVVVQAPVAVREPVVEAAPLMPVATPKVVEPAVRPQPKVEAAFVEMSVAIVYGDEFAGLPTANGEIFNQSDLSAAHPTLPLPSFVKVTNPATGKQVVVRVNDRGPFEDGADFQVSRGAATALGFGASAQASLQLEYMGPANSVPAKPRTDAQGPKPIVMQASAPVTVNEDDLLGGDELAGGAGWSAPAQKKRVDVIWPEPPAEWGVAPAKAATKPAAAGSLYVQLASFSDQGNANALYRDLKADLPVEIVPARVNGTDYYRVRVGPLDSRASAEQLRDRLNAEGKGDGRVVSAE